MLSKINSYSQKLVNIPLEIFIQRFHLEVGVVVVRLFTDQCCYMFCSMWKDFRLWQKRAALVWIVTVHKFRAVILNSNLSTFHGVVVRALICGFALFYFFLFSHLYFVPAPLPDGQPVKYSKVQYTWLACHTRMLVYLWYLSSTLSSYARWAAPVKFPHFV